MFRKPEPLILTDFLRSPTTGVPPLIRGTSVAVYENSLPQRIDVSPVLARQPQNAVPPLTDSDSLSKPDEEVYFAQRPTLNPAKLVDRFDSPITRPPATHPAAASSPGNVDRRATA